MDTPSPRRPATVIPRRPPSLAALGLAACALAACGLPDDPASAGAARPLRSSAPDCDGVIAPEIDVRFGADGAAAVQLHDVEVCPQTGPSLTDRPPVVSPRLLDRLAVSAPGDRIGEVTFVVKSELAPTPLPRFGRTEPRDPRGEVASARRAAFAELAAGRAAEQQWLVEAITERGDEVISQHTLGSLVVATVSAGTLAELTSDPRLHAIAELEVGGLTTAPSGGPVRSVLDARRQIAAERLYGRGYTGSPYRIGTIDHGIDAGHELLAGVAGPGQDCTSGDCSGGYPEDCTDAAHPGGHGTSVAHIAAGNDAYGPAYQGVSAAAVDSWKVLLKAGEYCSIAQQDWVPTAIEHAVLVDDVINASVALSTASPEAEMAAEAAFNEAYQSGAILIAAAGNAGHGGAPSVASPARANNVLAVGAVEADGALADYSSDGPASDGRIKPDLVAPTDIHAACAGDPACLAAFNGTSAASPVAAGVAAQLLDVYDTFAGSNALPLVVAGRIYATMIAFGTPLDGSNHAPDDSEGAGLLALGDTRCARWRWGSAFIHDGIDASRTFHLPQGAENVRVAIWYSDLGNGVFDLGHAQIELRLSKGAETHVSALPTSVFQRLRVPSLAPGTWTVDLEWTGGDAQPGSSRLVHYFWYSEDPAIACDLTLAL